MDNICFKNTQKLVDTHELTADGEFKPCNFVLIPRFTQAVGSNWWCIQMTENACWDIPVFEKCEKYSHNNSEIKGIADWTDLYWLPLC